MSASIKDDALQEGNQEPDDHKKPPIHIRLPAFITDKDIGLGDAIKHATSYIAIKPCTGCEERAKALNNWIVFGPKAV